MNALSRFEPFTSLSAWREAMHQFLDEGAVSPRDLLPSVLASMVVPLDVLDSGEDILVRAAMPGVKAENLKIMLNGNILTLKTEAEAGLENATYLRRERHLTSLSISALET